MSHITAKDLQDCLEGSASPDQTAQLLRHLEEGCESCECLLDDGIDLETLTQLVQAETGDSEPLSASERAQIWQASAPRARSQVWRWAGVGLALAAAILLWVAVPMPPVEAPSDGIKGAELSKIQVDLRVLTGKNTATGFTLSSRLEAGQEVSSETTLLFEVDASQPASRTLFVVDESGEITVLFPVQAPVLEVAGRRRLTSGGDWVALDLSGWKGPFQLVAAASATVQEPTEITDAWRRSTHVDGVYFTQIDAVVVP